MSVTLATGCGMSSKTNSSGAPASAAQLTASQNSLSFGTVPTGGSKALSENISNAGGSALTVSQISANGAGFNVTGINPPVTLSPGQSASFRVLFAPQSVGTASGSLSIMSSAANGSVSIPLSASGAFPGQLSITPSSISFGNVTVGANQTLTATLTANNGPVTVESATISGPEFSITGAAFPLTIAAGSTASVNVRFTPQASGTASGALVISGAAANLPASTALSGTGMPAPQHVVTLTWNPSTSSNVIGYNLFRGVKSGGPYVQINSASGTSAFDNSVQGGHTYFYVVTADSGSLQSPYSNEVQAVIPFP